MLSSKEEMFVKYWAENRDRQRKLLYQFGFGLPAGLLMGAFIFANFLSGWYKRAEMVANSSFNPLILVLAVAIIAVFFAVFSKKFQWEQREMLYRELLHKKHKEMEHAAANGTDKQSLEMETPE